MLCDDFLEVKHNLGFIGGILTVDLCSFNEILFFYGCLEKGRT